VYFTFNLSIYYTKIGGIGVLLVCISIVLLFVFCNGQVQLLGGSPKHL
jgi:hypothetical protein